MKRSRRLISLFVVLALAAVAVLVACGGEGFQLASKVDSVRLFGVRADKPYAKPGETVTLEALFADGRRDKPREAQLYWIPILCVNPQDDLYYLCFAPPGDGGRQAGTTRLVPVGPLAEAGAPDAGGAGAGAGGPFAQIPTGIDLAPFLPQGPTFSFRMPEDAVQPREGNDPYGLVIVFNILCAGRVEFAERDPGGGIQQVPVLCTDENGVKLPPSDYVIGISRVYARSDRTNANPVIEGVTLAQQPVDPAQGVTVPVCTAERERDCEEIKLDVRVPDSSWELNPSDVSRDGEIREQVWASYFSNVGTFDSDARLLFDSTRGRIPESDVTFRAPKVVADGTLWVVVRDNRGGASWIVVPLHVR